MTQLNAPPFGAFAQVANLAGYGQFQERQVERGLRLAQFNRQSQQRQQQLDTNALQAETAARRSSANNRRSTGGRFTDQQSFLSDVYKMELQNYFGQQQQEQRHQQGILQEAAKQAELRETEQQKMKMEGFEYYWTPEATQRLSQYDRRMGAIHDSIAKGNISQEDGYAEIERLEQLKSQVKQTARPKKSPWPEGAGIGDIFTGDKIGLPSLQVDGEPVWLTRDSKGDVKAIPNMPKRAAPTPERQLSFKEYGELRQQIEQSMHKSDESGKIVPPKPEDVTAKMREYIGGYRQFIGEPTSQSEPEMAELVLSDGSSIQAPVVFTKEQLLSIEPGQPYVDGHTGQGYRR